MNEVFQPEALKLAGGVMCAARSRSRTSELGEASSPSEKKSFALNGFTVKRTLFISEVFPPLRLSNQSPEPTRLFALSLRKISFRSNIHSRVAHL